MSTRLRGVGVYLFVLFLFPYIPLLTHFTRDFALAGGKNLYLILSMVFLLCFVIVNATALKNDIRILFLACILGFVVVFVLRIVFLDEPWETLFPSRPIIGVLVYLLAAKLVAEGNPTYRAKMMRILLVNSFAQALVGITHYFWFPQFVTGQPEFMATGELFRIGFSNPISLGRESGLLGNANVYANFILIGIYLAAIERKMKSVMKQVYLVVCAIGILLSGSRFPFLFAVVFLIVYLFRNRDVRSWFLIAATGVCSWIILYDRIFYVLSRLNTEDIDRLNKYFLGLRLAVDSFGVLLVGQSSEVVRNTFGPLGEVFADNSYIELLILYGWPLTLFFIGALSWMFHRQFRKNKVYLLYVCATLFVTNSVLYDTWVLYLCASFFLLMPWSTDVSLLEDRED